MPTRRAPPLAFVAIVVLSCSGASPGEPITLTFDWPVGTTFQVEAQIENRQEMNGVPQTSGGTYRYRTVVEPHERGLLLRTSSFESLTPGAGGTTDAFLAELLSQVVPSTIVSHEGELLEIVELEEMVDYVRGFVADSLGEIDSEAFESWMNTMLSEETLGGMAAQEWNALVGFWVGAELEVGAEYEMETVEPLLVFPTPVTWRYEFGISARVPCESSPGEVLEGRVGPEADCVELILRSYPDPDAVEEFLQEMIDDLMADIGGGELPSFAYDGLEIENEIMLVAEPVGLLPHALTMVQRVETTVTVGGESQRGGGTRIRRFRYTY